MPSSVYWIYSSPSGPSCPLEFSPQQAGVRRIVRSGSCKIVGCRVRELFEVRVSDFQRLVRRAKLLCAAYQVGDIPRDFGDSNDLTRRILDGRDGQRHRKDPAVLGFSLGLIMIDAFSALEPVEDFRNFVDRFRRGKHGDMFADHLLGGIPEDALGTPVPTSDVAVKVLAQDASSEDSTMAAIRACSSLTRLAR